MINDIYHSKDSFRRYLIMQGDIYALIKLYDAEGGVETMGKMFRKKQW